MTPVALLKASLRTITIKEACWLMQLYGDADDVFFLIKKKGNCDVWHSSSLSNLDRDSNEYWTIALHHSIRFYGGPEGHYYYGTIVSFVIDRLLRAEQTRKIGWHWVCRFNTYSAIPMSKQLKAFVPSALRQMSLFDTDRNALIEAALDVGDDEIPFDSYSGTAPVDYVQIGNDLYPIFEDGRQGKVVQRAGSPVSLDFLSRPAHLAPKNETVYLCSASGAAERL